MAESGQMENFNNELVHTQSWYPLIASSRVGRERCQGIQLFGRRLVVFREKSGRVRVLLARCPHMGADLSDGKVSGGMLECPFHAWKFDGDGPLSPSGPRKAPSCAVLDVMSRSARSSKGVCIDYQPARPLVLVTPRTPTLVASSWPAGRSRYHFCRGGSDPSLS